MSDVQAQPCIAVLAIIDRIAEVHNLPRGMVLSDVLVDAGMTSLAIVDLIFAVEAQFEISIPDEELTVSNFRSGLSIAKLIERVWHPIHAASS